MNDIPPLVFVVLWAMLVGSLLGSAAQVVAAIDRNTAACEESP